MREINVDELCITNGVIYGLNYKYSILVEFDIDTYEAKDEYLITIDANRLKYNNESEIWHHMIIGGECGYLIGHYTNRIVKIDLKEKSQEIILLDILPETLSLIGYEENVLYIYAVESGTVISINILDEKIQYFKLPKTYIGNINCGELKIYHKSVFASGYIKNKILEINCSTGGLTEHSFSDIEGDICLYAWNEKYLACISQTEVLLWDINHKCKKEKIALPKSFLLSDSEMPFYRSVVIKNKLVLFPYHTRGLLIVDMNTYQLQNIYLSEDVVLGNRMRNVGYLDVDMHYIYALDDMGREYLIDLENEKIERIFFRIQNQTLEDIKKNFFSLRELMTEGEMFNILEMLNYIDSGCKNIKGTNVGEKIYRMC